MAETTITLKGWDELVATIGKIAALEGMKPAMQRAVDLVLDGIAKYPEPPGPGSFKGFVSDKQRRWFFAALRKGEVQVPYRRTGLLGKSWTTEVNISENELTGIVGNNTAYAGWVQGPTFPAKTSHGQYQAKVHQGRWQTADDVLTENADKIMSIFGIQLEAVWNAENETGNVPG